METLAQFLENLVCKKTTHYENARKRAENSTEATVNTVKQVRGLTDEIKGKLERGCHPDLETIDILAHAVQQEDVTLI